MSLRAVEHFCSTTPGVPQALDGDILARISNPSRPLDSLFFACLLLPGGLVVPPCFDHARLNLMPVNLFAPFLFFLFFCVSIF